MTFEQVLSQYEPMLYKMMHRLHIYRNEDDFLQVGRIALWQAYEKFDETKGTFSAFAYVSVRGAMLDELKRQAKHNVTIGVEQQTLAQYASETRDDTLFLLKQLLTEEEQSLLFSLYLYGKTYEQLAEEEGVTVGAIKKRRQRIVQNIRQRLPASLFFQNDVLL